MGKQSRHAAAIRGLLDPSLPDVVFRYSRTMAYLCSTLAFVLVVAALAGPAAALEDGGAAAVSQVVDGDTVVLDRAIAGATQVRLTGIQAPKLALGRPGFKAWPLAEEAKKALESLILGRVVRLRYGGRRMDRHGRILAHLYRDGLWVQGALLERGLARVYSFRDNRALVSEMLAKEGRARNEGRGIWGLRFYAIRAPAETGRFIDTFQVVEGTVLDAAAVRGRVYLNFGPDWRTDFTVSLSSKTHRLFKQDGIDPLVLAGQRVRVRGWLKSFNGPLIEATHPEQIEVGAP